MLRFFTLLPFSLPLAPKISPDSGKKDKNDVILGQIGKTPDGSSPGGVYTRY